jgi:hypothetical protein
MPQARFPSDCTLNTEILMQKTSWGLMQIMGATARSVGFDGWLPELTDAKTNVRTGTAYLALMMGRHYKRHGLPGVIAAYNAGSPRTRPDGKFVNQSYVDKVLKAMEKYKPIVEEKGEEALAEHDKAIAEETSGTEGNANENKTTEDAFSLDKLNKAQLLEYAKEKGFTVDAKWKVEDIRAAIRAAEAGEESS